MSDQVQEEIELFVNSYSERRKYVESQKEFRGENIYGGERCQCVCGDIHWRKPIEKVEVPTK